jgi:hypothetical protein
MCKTKNRQHNGQNDKDKKNKKSDGQPFHQYINKANNHLSPQINEEHKKGHNILR